MRFSINILPATVALASFMAREADAIYLPGIVRLFRGEGDLTDAVTSNDGTDLFTTNSVTPTFPIETPYMGVSRQVFYFDDTGKALGSTEGLPDGDKPRTIVGWTKKGINDRFYGHHFGYGKATGTSMTYNAFFDENYDDGTDLLDIITLDQWLLNENFDQELVAIIDEWFHYAATWDGTKNTIYIDGEKKTEGVPNLNPDTAVGDG
jgi:hypothetical protein